ncbi:MAG: hypothetical protein ACOWYE_12570 [Desulfatiglandales bacterium]
MLPLLFILVMTGLSVLLTSYCSSEVTWFTYYIGVMIGLFASGLILEFWTRRKRKQENQ